MKSYRNVNGILLLDKPQGLSSNQALQRVRRLFNASKAGHTGSLDPLATGLLPVCFGEATKIAGYLLGSRKAYEAEVRFGMTTTTDDAEGEVVSTRPVPPLSDALIEAALCTLRGRIEQTPPVYSAIKQGGVALYRRARRGEEISVPSREVEVYRLEVIAAQADRLSLHVECASGTYVRSLARDLGERLGCGAHLTALRRLWVEPFTRPAMHRLDEIEAALADRGLAGADALLLPLEDGLQALPALCVDAEQAVWLRQGKRFVQDRVVAEPLCCVTDSNGRIVALAEIDAAGEVRVRRGFSAGFEGQDSPGS